VKPFALLVAAAAVFMMVVAVDWPMLAVVLAAVVWG